VYFTDCNNSLSAVTLTIIQKGNPIVVGLLKIDRYVVNLEEFNIYCTLSFNTQEENENSLNFLDVAVKRMENHINISIFR
jgi:hypothetical protein